jgi:hypothetical protein
LPKRVVYLMASDRDLLKRRIRGAFAEVGYPGDWCLRGSNEGEEPFLLEKEFKGKSDWRTLDAKFLDGAPEGFASALAFFSDEAFRFYLPAYLIADIDGRLESTDLVFYLCHGLDDKAKGERVNSKRYGERTWFDCRRYRFSVFNERQCRVIVAYLHYKRSLLEDGEPEAELIDQALQNYWQNRAGKFAV